MTIDHTVARQAGVLTLAQAVERGMSQRTVQRRAGDGSWDRLHPATHLVGGHRLTDEARVRAAWLWAGEQAAVSGAAAAYWHGMLPAAPPDIELTVPRQAHLRRQPGIRLRRRDLSFRDRIGYATSGSPAVEVDGWAWHVDPERFRADRREGNALVRGGWDLLRFTWHDLDGRPAEVVAEITETLVLAAAARSA